MRIHNPQLNENARKLRKEMTYEELKLWNGFLRGLPVCFLRQKIIYNYIVDFYCARAHLIIEIDGSQHYENEEIIQQDLIRDKFLSDKGYTVLRYTNLEVNSKFKYVCEDIYNHISPNITSI